MWSLQIIKRENYCSAIIDKSAWIDKNREETEESRGVCIPNWRNLQLKEKEVVLSVKNGKGSPVTLFKSKKWTSRDVMDK